MYTTFGIIGLASLASFVLYAALRLSLGVIRIALRIIARLRKPAPAPAPVPARNEPKMTREAAQEVLAQMQRDYLKQKQAGRSAVPVEASAGGPWINTCDDPRQDYTVLPGPAWAQDTDVPCIELVNRPDHVLVADMVEDLLNRSEAVNALVIYEQGEWYKIETDGVRRPGFPEGTYWFRYMVDGKNRYTGPHSRIDGVLRGVEIARHQRWAREASKASR